MQMDMGAGLHMGTGMKMQTLTRDIYRKYIYAC